jgi:hypothetical protein
MVRGLGSSMAPTRCSADASLCAVARTSFSTFCRGGRLGVFVVIAIHLFDDAGGTERRDLGSSAAERRGGHRFRHNRMQTVPIRSSGPSTLELRTQPRLKSRVLRIYPVL